MKSSLILLILYSLTEPRSQDGPIFRLNALKGHLSTWQLVNTTQRFNWSTTSGSKLHLALSLGHLERGLVRF